MRSSFGKAEIQKNLISDYSDLTRRTNFIQFFHLAGFAEMSGGIIRIDHNDSARALGDGPLQSVKIDLPSVVIQQGIAYELYILNIRQKTEERITGFGDQKFVARIAKNAKRETVCLAGAGSKNHVFRGNHDFSA